MSTVQAQAAPTASSTAHPQFAAHAMPAVQAEASPHGQPAMSWAPNDTAPLQVPALHEPPAAPTGLAFDALSRPAVDAAAPGRSDQAAPPPQPAAAPEEAAGAPAALQAVARVQSQAISADAQADEAQATRVATAHRQRMGGHFGGVRSALAAQVAQSGAAVQAFFAAKGAEASAAAGAAMRGAQDGVTATVAAADAQVGAARAAIDGFVAGVTGSLQQRVMQIAGQVSGAVRSVPFPDLPGVGAIRAAAAGLAERAAGVITGGLAQVRGAIGAALQSSVQVLGNVLGSVRQTANAALAQVGGTVQRSVLTVSRGLSSLAGRVVGALRNLLTATVVPMLDRLEGQALRSLETARQHAITAIRGNRDQHLQAIGAALHAASPGAGAGVAVGMAAGVGAGAGSVAGAGAGAGAGPGAARAAGAAGAVGGAGDAAAVGVIGAAGIPVAAGPSGPAGAVAATARSAEGGAAALQTLGEAARRQGRAILQTFEERTTTIVGSVVSALSGGASRVAALVSQVVTQATQAVAARMRQVGEAFGRLVQAVSGFMRSLLQDATEGIAWVIAGVRALVQAPVDTLLQFAQRAVSRALGFVGGWVRRLLSGDFGLPTVADVIGSTGPVGGPITKPPPGGPITLPGLAPILIAFAIFGAVVLYAVPELAVVITALMALGLSASAALVVLGVLALLALILLFAVIYLLYQAFKPAPKPAPPPPPPPPPPEQITSLTVVNSPGVRTRTTIGVGEQVFLTHTPGPANWSTTGGTVSPNAGTVVMLSAPDTAQTITVTGGAATIDFDVVAPTGVHMDRLAGTGIKHTKDHADSGIATLPFLLPDTVNFNRVTYREINVGATVTNPGAYSCHSGAGHCAQPAGGPCPDLFMTDTVLGGKGTQAIRGDCVYSGDCLQTAPFTPGNITFATPYEYKVDRGAYRQFVVVNQVSALAADGTTLTSDKAGAHGATTVPAASGAIPQCP